MSININSRVVVQDDPNLPAKIVVPSPEAVASGRDWNNIKGAHQGAVNKVECETIDIPEKDELRNAWDLDVDASDSTYSGKKVKLNMIKGVECAKECIRQGRNKKLAELDIEYQREDEKGNAAGKAAVAAKKQTARDATDDVRLTNAVDEIELKQAITDINAEVAAL